MKPKPVIEEQTSFLYPLLAIGAFVVVLLGLVIGISMVNENGLNVIFFAITAGLLIIGIAEIVYQMKYQTKILLKLYEKTFPEESGD